MKGGLMSYTLGINLVPSFKYSNNNQYAREYYNTCQELKGVHYQIQNCHDCSKLEALLKKRDFLEKKTSNTLNKVEKEENRIGSSNNNEQHKINYLA